MCKEHTFWAKVVPGSESHFCFESCVYNLGPPPLSQEQMHNPLFSKDKNQTWVGLAWTGLGLDLASSDFLHR